MDGKRLIFALLGIALCALLAVGSAAFATTNITSSPTTYRWAWNDVIGWIDFYVPDTVVVSATGVAGYASSSAGEISLDCATSPAGNICAPANGNYTVINNGAGDLSGWAWNDVIGWISFCGGQSTTNCPGAVSYRALINGTTGEFTGWGWNDLVGWVSFCGGQATSGCPGIITYKVNTTWTATSTTGHLDSATYDTGVAGGAQINSILWHGSLPQPTNGSFVAFQIAASSTSNGHNWNYVGPDGTANTYYPSGAASASGTAIPVSYTLHNNMRYFRYRMFLSSTLTQNASPRVDSVSVNWSR